MSDIISSLGELLSGLTIPQTIGLALGLYLLYSNRLTIQAWFLKQASAVSATAVQAASAQPSAAKVVTATGELDAIGAYQLLSQIRAMPKVGKDPEALKACEYLRSVVTAWDVQVTAS
jgi:hypothetical protein